MPDPATFLDHVCHHHPDQPEFHQAVREVAEKVLPFIDQHPRYAQARVLERLVEPDRVVIFRVTWEDDEGAVRINRGYRVQQSNAIGPYKGGLRFDPSVNLSVLKFLAFEQVFKNSLTTLPLGGAKGGADFDPKGKSHREVMRFCQAFMTELYRHIGPHTDVPAGDIGVGAREIGYLFGQYKRITGTFGGVLTGKGTAYGGSLIRPEATGYGCVYFAQEMLRTRGEDLTGKRCLVSGAGNVALFTAEKLLDLGAVVLTLSDRTGLLHLPDGLSREQLRAVEHVKTEERGSLADYAERESLPFEPNARPWHIEADAAFPSATQNEISDEDAQALLDGGCRLVCEGANMPSTAAASRRFEEADMLYGPGKAANAGGVAVSGLEMTQNAMRLSWSRKEVDRRLQDIMRAVHATCVTYGDEDGRTNYVKGANIGGFKKVADALVAFGAV